jgi:uncharacterized membrane protein (UPF0127 family)
LKQVPLTIQSASGTHRFTVEVAETPEQQAQGLMNRQSLGPDRGMIFPRNPPGDASFWMKNTLIPLDMIFADATGTVTRVHSGAVPGDLTPIDGGEGVQFVLEINAGLAEKLGIEPGSVMRHPAIGEGAAWGCES